jgi:hypothetical protein
MFAEHSFNQKRFEPENLLVLFLHQHMAFASTGIPLLRRIPCPQKKRRENVRKNF